MNQLPRIGNIVTESHYHAMFAGNRCTVLEDVKNGMCPMVEAIEKVWQPHLNAYKSLSNPLKLYSQDLVLGIIIGGLVRSHRDRFQSRSVRLTIHGPIFF